MELKKCPRCELNYIREDEKLCSVCSNSGRSRQISDDSHMVCSECGENRPMPGKTVCAACYKELRRIGYNSDDDILAADELDIDFDTDIDDVDIDVDIDEEIPESELEEIDRELGEDDLDDMDDEDID